MKYALRCLAVAVSLAVTSFSLPVFAETAQAPTAAPAVVQTESQAKAVNINTADAQTITDAKIKGIGKKRAEAIVAYRGEHGPFKSVDDLKNVKGISVKIIDANRSKLSVG